MGPVDNQFSSGRMSSCAARCKLASSTERSSVGSLNFRFCSVGSPANEGAGKCWLLLIVIG